MVFIKESNLKYLTQHKYNSTGYSFLDKVLNRVLWEPLAYFLPAWLAPNLVSVLGLVCMVASYLVMVPFDSTFSKQIPSYVLYLSAFLIFGYQTLDAVDGKHARNIGASSPLGMLIDHGCDALSSTLIILALSQAAGLGVSLSVYLIFLGVYWSFYLAQWEEYHTHFCRTHFMNIGVTEGQWLNVIVIACSGLLGKDIYKLEVLGVQLEYCLVIPSLLTGVMISGKMLYSTFSTTKEPLNAAGRLIPLVLITVSLSLWFIPMGTETEKVHSRFSIILLIQGVVFALCCSKIIICSVSKMEFPWFQTECILMLVWVCEVKFFQVLPFEMTLVFVGAYVAKSYMRFVVGVISQISNYLGISVFKVELNKNK